MNLAANMQYTIGVSFPQQYLPGYTAPPQEDDIDIVTIGLVLASWLVSVIIAAAFCLHAKAFSHRKSVWSHWAYVEV